MMMRPWTNGEVELLVKNYRKTSREWLCMKLERSWQSITSKAQELKLKRPKHEVYIRLSSVKPLQLDDFWRGYVAGMLDSEGCIMIKVKRKRELSPRVAIANKNKTVLKKLREVIGMGTMDNASKGKVYELVVDRMDDILSFLEGIRNSLMVKREQAELVIEFIRLRAENPFEYSQREWEIYREIKRINGYRWKSNRYNQCMGDIGSSNRFDSL